MGPQGAHFCIPGTHAASTGKRSSKNPPIRRFPAARPELILN